MIFQHHNASLTPSAALYGCAGYIPVHLTAVLMSRVYPPSSFEHFWKCRKAGLSGIQSVQHLVSPVPEWKIIPMPECRCRWHQPWCRFPAMHKDNAILRMLGIRNAILRRLSIRRKTSLRVDSAYSRGSFQVLWALSGNWKTFGKFPLVVFKVSVFNYCPNLKKCPTIFGCLR